MKGEAILAKSPGIFGGVGSEIILTDDDETASIWNAEESEWRKRQWSDRRGPAYSVLKSIRSVLNPDLYESYRPSACSNPRCTTLAVSWYQWSQTTTVIPANEAPAHVGQYTTVEGVVAKVFTSKTGNTFLNIGAAYPNQTFTDWIPPASPVSKSAVVSDVEGKHVKIIGRIEMYKGKPEIRINAASQLEVEWAVQ
jgi:hypothetical protein